MIVRVLKCIHNVFGRNWSKRWVAKSELSYVLQNICVAYYHDTSHYSAVTSIITSNLFITAFEWTKKIYFGLTGIKLNV